MLKSAALAATLLVPTAVFSQLASIGVQFEGVGDGTALSAAQIAGYVPQANWNVDSMTTGVLDTNLVDSAGAAVTTTVNVTYTSGQYYSSDDASTPDGALLSAGFWSGGGYTINVTNVPYSSYNIYLYMLNDNNPFRRYSFSLGNQTNWAAVFNGSGNTGNGFTVPPYTLGTETVEAPLGAQSQADVVEFTNVTGSGFVISGTTPDGNVALMGIEIVNASAGPAVADVIRPSTNTSLIVGQPITLSEIPVSGAAPFTYQWLTDGGRGGPLTPISGATSSSLAVNTSAFTAGNYNYEVIVGNTGGSSTSAVQTLTVPVTSPTKAISVEFYGNSDSGALVPGAAAGFVPEQFWNVDYLSSGNTDSNLMDSTGATTAASVNVKFANGQYRTLDNATNADGILLSGGYWSGGGYTIAVSNVPYSSYDVYLYMLNDNNPNRRYGFTLGDQTYWGSVFSGGNYVVPPYTLTTETEELPEGTQMQATLVEFTGISGSAFTITGETPDGNVALMGMQIVNPDAGPALASDIRVSPSGVTIYAGVDVVLDESPTSGTTPLFYQWLTDGGTGGTLTNIPAATNSTLAVNTTPFASGNYSYEVVVSNSLGVSTSAVQVVTVTASAPIIISDISPSPTNEDYIGETTSFSATFGGTLPMELQWYFNNGSGAKPISSAGNPTAITSTLILSNIQSSEAGTYYLTASNDLGTNVTSTSVLTTLNDLPTPGTGFGGAVLADHPLGYWQLNETEDPSTGILPAYDSSGHNLDGVYGVNAENGFNNIYGPQSPAFPGFPANNTALQTQNAAPSSYVTVPQLNNSSSSMTFTMWINPTAVQATFSSLFYYENETGSDQAGVNFSGTLNAAEMPSLGYTWNSNSAATYNWNSGLFPLQNQWSFVALVITPQDATEYLYYVDPITGGPDLFSAINNVTNGVETFDGTNLIGGIANDPAGSFTGDIDDVAIFNQALSSSQILAMFTNAIGLGTPIAPQISGQPQSAAAFTGETVTFAATGINGTAPFGYQWNYITANATNKLSDGGAIAGSSTAALTISGLAATNIGSYQLVVTNGSGRTNSSVVSLDVVTPNTYEAAVLQYHPLAYWPLNETNIDPSTGNAIAYEYISYFNGTYGVNTQNGYDGVLGPESPAEPGFPSVNYALETFTGTSGNCFVSASAGDLTTGNLTYAMWIYPTAAAPNWAGLLMDRGGAGEGFGFGGVVNGLGMSELGYTWNQNNQDTWGWNTGIFPPLNEWSFVALVIEPSQATIYMINTNGIQATNNVIPQDNETFGVAWHIGNDIADGNIGDRNFPGMISSVAVYLSSLSSNQIVTLADTGLGVTPPPPPITLGISSTPDVTKGLTLTWSSGTLLEATNLNGPWVTNASATSPYNIVATNSQSFFKIVK